MDVFNDHPALRFALGVLVLAFGLVLAAFLAWQLAQDLTLWVFGREVEAQVVDRWVEQLGDRDEGELTFRYYLQYRFEASSGETITSTTTVSVNEWAGGMGGESQVDVVYFPLYPAHSRLDDARYVPILACLYVPTILLALATLAAARHLLRALPRARAGEGGGDAPNGKARDGGSDGISANAAGSDSHSQDL